MGICSNEIFTVSTRYDCVKICDRPTYPTPEVEYEIDLDSFSLTAVPISFNGQLEYKWVITDNGYEIYSSGYGSPNDALPLMGNASTYEEFLFGTDYVELKDMLNVIAPYYVGRELKFSLQMRDASLKDSLTFSELILTL